MAKKNNGRTKREKPFIYPSSSQPGAGLIIANEHFKELPQRVGNSADVERCQETLKYLGFRDIDVVHDLTAEMILLTVESFVTRRVHDKAVASFFCIFTHGNRDVVFGADDVALPTDDIFNLFGAGVAKSLAGKPKFFLLNCCRGIQDDIVVFDHIAEVDKFTSDGRHDKREKPKKGHSRHADCLKAWSTSYNTVSWRNHYTGSIFGKVLCEQLKELAHSEDAAAIFTEASGLVANHFRTLAWVNQQPVDICQQPVIESTLSGRFFFLPRGSSCHEADDSDSISIPASVDFQAEYDYKGMLLYLCGYLVKRQKWRKNGLGGGHDVWEPYVEIKYLDTPLDQRPKPRTIGRQWVRHRGQVLILPDVERVSACVPLYVAFRMGLVLSASSMKSLDEIDGHYSELRPLIEVSNNIVTSIPDWSSQLSEALALDSHEDDEDEDDEGEDVEDEDDEDEDEEDESGRESSSSFNSSLSLSSYSPAEEQDEADD